MSNVRTFQDSDHPIINDSPMQDIFSDPKSKVSFIGELTDQMPEAIADLLTEHGLTRKSFNCMLKEVPIGGSANGSEPYIKAWTRSIPTIDYIGRNYGAGTYRLILSWKTPYEDVETGKRKQKNNIEKIEIVISDKYNEEYKKHRFDGKVAEMKRQAEAIKDAKIEKSLNKELDDIIDSGINNNIDAKTSGKEYVKEIVDSMKMLGLGDQKSVVEKGFDWDKILMLAGTVVPPLLKMISDNSNARQERNDKMMMLLLNQSNTGNKQLIDVMQATQGNGSGMLIMKEITEMVKGSLNLKDMMSEKKETVADRIFSMIESVAPQLLAIASQPKPVQAINPQVGMAKQFIDSNEDFQKIKDDPALLVDLVKKLDAFYGVAQTDGILNIAGYDRPAECTIQEPIIKEVENEEPES